MANERIQIKDLPILSGGCDDNDLLMLQTSSTGTTKAITKKDLLSDILSNDTLVNEINKVKDDFSSQLKENTNEINNIKTDYAKKTDVNDLVSNKAEKELCTITHNLDCMPDIQLIYLNGAYGIGGYDESSYGGSGVMNKGSYKVEYVDNNILKIYIANNYYISDGVVVKDETNKYEYSYILTSEASNNSIIINIK